MRRLLFFIMYAMALSSPSGGNNIGRRPMRYLVIPLAASAAILFAAQAPVWAQAQGRTVLTDAQLDKVTAGVNERQLKRKTTPPTFTFGEFKSGRCRNLGQCKKD